MSVHASRPPQICTTILGLTLFNQSLQPVAIAELVCVLLTMSNVALELSLESGHLAWLAQLPGITYLRTCNTALTQMYLRKGSRHFCSNVHSSQIDFILVFMYFSIVSAPGHFCIAALYKFSVYCIVLYCSGLASYSLRRTINK